MGEPHTDDMHVSMCTYVLICLHWMALWIP